MQKVIKNYLKVLSLSLFCLLSWQSVFSMNKDLRSKAIKFEQELKETLLKDSAVHDFLQTLPMQTILIESSILGLQSPDGYNFMIRKEKSPSLKKQAKKDKMLKYHTFLISLVSDAQSHYDSATVELNLPIRKKGKYYSIKDRYFARLMIIDDETRKADKILPTAGAASQSAGAPVQLQLRAIKTEGKGDDSFVQVQTIKPWFHKCKNCGAIRNLRKCSGCKTVRYCSKECQKDHWSSHKKNCKQKK